MCLFTSNLFLTEMEFAKGLQKMANSCKQTISQETNMPFLSIYLLALEQDMEHGTSVLQAANTLQHQTFLQVRGQKVLPGLERCRGAQSRGNLHPALPRLWIFIPGTNQHL